MKYLEQTMRWYGPRDAVKLSDIRQAGATGIVSALHDIPVGDIWTKEAIKAHKSLIEEAGMSWSVVESVNVHEAIKTAGNQRDQYISWYQDTLRNLSEVGIRTVCYNFMPVVDWTRTDLEYMMKDGSKALRFEMIALIAFDLFILKRKNAESDYSEEQIRMATERYEKMTADEREQLRANVTMGLPGAASGWTVEEVREKLSTYENIDRKELQDNLAYFLKAIVPVAEENEIRLAIHPDDPPISLLGLPRVVSTEADAKFIVDAAPSPSNGLCLCTGSYGVRADNDLPGMAQRLASHIHFIHLRNVKREEYGSFYEADHLAGETDMYEVMSALCTEQQRRENPIPMRPDHGHAMLDDINKVTNPGYTAIGRLRGLAELRGLEYAILKRFASN